MSANHLSKDIHQWPVDPFALLGIEHDASERDAKRAYTRLIRIYNPEHSPNEFRRIREAYEAATQQIQWGQSSYKVDHEDVEEENPPADDEVTLIQPRSELDLDSQLRDLWSTVTPHRYQEIYDQLKRLLQNHPHEEEIAIRMYWLHLLVPSLDESISSIDLLKPCLSRQGVSGRVGELLVRSLNTGSTEFDFNATESEFMISLLKDSRSRSHLFEFLRQRWQRVVSQNDWKSLVHDLNRLENVFLDDISGWLSLHLLALDSARLSRNSNATGIVKRCMSVFESEADLELQHSHDFDQADFAAEVHHEMTHLQFDDERCLPNEFRQLLITLGKNPFWDIGQKRQLMMPVLADWARSPEESLNRLGTLSSNFRFLRIVIFDVVSEIYYENASDSIPSIEELRNSLNFELSQGTRITDFSHSCHYSQLRQEILNFCLAEFVDVEYVARLLAEMNPHVPVDEYSWLARLFNDVPLKTLVRGHLAFWQHVQLS